MVISKERKIKKRHSIIGENQHYRDTCNYDELPDHDSLDHGNTQDLRRYA